MMTVALWESPIFGLKIADSFGAFPGCKVTGCMLKISNLEPLTYVSDTALDLQLSEMDAQVLAQMTCNVPCFIWLLAATASRHRSRCHIMFMTQAM